MVSHGPVLGVHLAIGLSQMVLPKATELFHIVSPPPVGHSYSAGRVPREAEDAQG